MELVPVCFRKLIYLPSRSWIVELELVTRHEKKESERRTNEHGVAGILLIAISSRPGLKTPPVGERNK
jgi:hypothetical protein